MNRLLSALFALVISLPLAATIAGVGRVDAGAENRELAPFPRYDGTFESIARYGNQFGHWFDDHFGFRSTLVRWYGEMRLFVLGTPPSPAVVQGRDGWFYYGEDGSIEDYARAEPLTPAALDNWRDTIVRTRDWLHGRGIAYVFFIAPDKYVLYPEFMPSTIRRVGPTSRTDQLYGRIHDVGSIVDVRPPLVAAKKVERIYHQTDTHWNDRGAFAAYQAIIAAVRTRSPATQPAWTRDDFEAEANETEGMDLAGMMGLTRVMREIDLALVPKRPRHARVVEPAGADAMAQEGRLVTEIPGSSQPRAVIFRDSFVSRLVPFLSEHFSRAVYLWQNDFDADVIQEEHPDVVIQEIVGRHIYTFIPTPTLIPN